MSFITNELLSFWLTIFVIKNNIVTKKMFFCVKKVVFCHYCHYCHYCNYCHYCHYYHFCHYYHRSEVRLVLVTIWYSKGNFFTSVTHGPTDGSKTRLLELLWAAKKVVLELLSNQKFDFFLHLIKMMKETSSNEYIYKFIL